jgi:hypothetical protein
VTIFSTVIAGVLAASPVQPQKAIPAHNAAVRMKHVQPGDKRIVKYSSAEWHQALYTMRNQL